MRYRFAGCEIDEERPVVLRDGEPIELQPKVFDVLLLLVQNADRMLTKDVILERVWGDVTVTDASLMRCVSLIRRELGEDAVRTTRGRGYQLGVPVEAVEAEAVGARTTPAPRRRRGWLVAALLALSFAGWIAWLGRPFARLDVPDASTPPELLATDVAVTPLEVFGGFADPDDLGHRIPLEVIDRLATANELHVASPASSFSLAPGATPDEIGRSLSVGTLVLGSIRPHEGGVRVSVEVVEAASGFRHWSKSFDTGVHDLPRVADEIAAQVAGVLGASIEGAVDYVSDAAVIEAARYYLDGRQAVVATKREHLLRAVELFERAIELDPDQPRAHAALAAAYERLWGLDEPNSPWLERGEAAARRALELAPGDPDVLTVLATIQRDRKDWTGAFELYREAIADGPSARAHDAMARFLCMLGRSDEALYHANRALELAPGLGSVHFTMARVEYYRGQPERALAHLERALQLDPRLIDLPTMLARVHDAAGHADLARESFLLASPPWFRPVLRIVDRLFGQDASLRLVMRLDEARAGRCPTRGLGRALVWARLGETDRMYECLARAADKLPWYALSEPGFAPYRRDPRFREIIERQGIPELPVLETAVTTP